MAILLIIIKAEIKSNIILDGKTLKTRWKKLKNENKKCCLGATN